MVEELRYLNGDLRKGAGKAEVPAEDDNHKVQDLKCRFNSQRCNFIRQCIYSLHGALRSGFCSTCSEPHQTAIGLDWQGLESDAAQRFKVASLMRQTLALNCLNYGKTFKLLYIIGMRYLA